MRSNHAKDLFDAQKTSTYSCDNDSLMELELRSSGLARSGTVETPHLTLRIRYAPALLDRHDEIVYLDPLVGHLILHYEDSARLIAIGPGGYANVASKVYLEGDDLKFELGIALREGSAVPTIARLSFSCPADAVAGTRCKGLRLATAVDQDGRVMSPRPLSALLDRPLPVANTGFGVVPPDLFGTEGSGSSCFFLCPTCKPEGCDSGVGICAMVGAPIACVSNCIHQPGTLQCCMSGSPSRACCRLRCGIVP
jgi:hypothetical protein